MWSASSVAGDRHVIEDGEAQERLHVDSCRLRSQRVQKKNTASDAALGDQGTELRVGRPAVPRGRRWTSISSFIGLAAWPRWSRRVQRAPASVPRLRAPTRPSRPCAGRERPVRLRAGLGSGNLGHFAVMAGSIARRVMTASPPPAARLDARPLARGAARARRGAAQAAPAVPGPTVRRDQALHRGQAQTDAGRLAERGCPLM